MLLLILLTAFFRPIFIFYSFLNGNNPLFEPSRKKGSGSEKTGKRPKNIL